MAPPPAEPMAFEELTSLYRKERASNALAELRHDFYTALSEMASRTHREYEKALASDPDSIVCEGLNQRRKKMLDIAQRIIDDRMDKIASMALKGGVGFGDAFTRLTPEEKVLYQNILESFRNHRSILPQLRKRSYHIAELPEEKAPAPEPEQTLEAEVVTEEAEVHMDAAPEPEPVDDGPLDDEEGDNVVIRVLEDLPTFSGPYRDYTLRKEDVVLMPRALADALISRQAAVEVRPRL